MHLFLRKLFSAQMSSHILFLKLYSCNLDTFFSVQEMVSTHFWRLREKGKFLPKLIPNTSFKFNQIPFTVWHNKWKVTVNNIDNSQKDGLLHGKI